MFYTAEALLFEQGLEFSKHGGVHAAYGERFAKTGVLDVKFHRFLLDAFRIRLEGDYGLDISISEDAVNEMIERAKEFLAVARDYLME